MSFTKTGHFHKEELPPQGYKTSEMKFQEYFPVDRGLPIGQDGFQHYETVY